MSNNINVTVRRSRAIGVTVRRSRTIQVTVNRTGATGPPGLVQSVVAGTNITVDNTDPANPIVNSTASGGAVDSVFARTGDVVAQTNDYDDTQVYVDDTDISAATSGTVMGNNVHAIFISLIASFSATIGSIFGELADVFHKNTDDTDDITDTATNRFTNDTDIARLASTSGTNTGDQDLSGLVPNTRTVNGHALSSNVTVTKSDVGLGNADNTSDANKPVSTAQQAALDLKQNLSGKDAANGYPGLDGSGKINPLQLPATAITETFVVNSQAAMLALTAQTGDVAVRTDLNKSFILTADPASTLGNWQELLTPTDAVSSVFARTGVVTAQNGDYTASQVTNVPAGNISGVTLQAAINELDSEKQPLNSDLTAIAALSPSNDDIIQRKAGVWVVRTMAQVKVDLGINNVDNTSDANKPVSTATQTALNLKLDASTYDDATTGETDTGTSTAKYVSPDGLAGSYAGTKPVSIEALPAATALTTGDGKVYFRIPPSLNGMDLVSVGAAVFAKSTSGLPTIQLARGRQANAATAHVFADMLTTKITIDANEFDSKDATTAPVIDTANDDTLTGDLIRIDIDVAGTGTTGLYITMQFRLP